MPYEWTEPELLMVHRGVPVYRTYSGGPGNETPNDYWYTLQACASDNDETEQFDVRTLPQLPEGEAAKYDNEHKARIAHAIDTGFFDRWEKDMPPYYWWLTDEQRQAIRGVVEESLYEDAFATSRDDIEWLCRKHAERRMSEMGIADLVEWAKHSEELDFDPEQQPDGAQV